MSQRETERTFANRMPLQKLYARNCLRVATPVDCPCLKNSWLSSISILDLVTSRLKSSVSIFKLDSSLSTSASFSFVFLEILYFSKFSACLAGSEVDRKARARLRPELANGLSIANY